MASIIGILLIVGGITLYRTFALYEEKLEFNVLKGRIPDFVSGDIQLAMTLDGEGITEIPKGRNYTVTVTCDTEEMSGTWNYNNWTVTISGAITKPTKCSINFSSIFKYYIDEEEVDEKPDKSIYLYKSMTCNKGTASYNENTKEETVTNYEEGMECSVYYVTPSTTLFSDYLIAKTLTDSSIIRQEHGATYQTGTNALIDYRYIGGDIDESNYVHNYVCLEASGTCTEDQLYRIIGVIPTQSSENGPYENRVKLIKATSYGTYYWSGSKEVESNNWTTSTLNTTVLNQEYWNSISSYHKYIDDTKWYLGGASGSSAARSYSYERGDTGGNRVKSPISSLGSVGLMYLSDYAFATSGGISEDREKCLSIDVSYYGSFYNTTSSCYVGDWLLDASKQQWTVTPYIDALLGIFEILANGSTSYNTWTPHLNSVRPVFHLRSDVRFQGGDGSKETPYTIEIG